MPFLANLRIEIDGAVDRERRGDDVDAAAVQEPRVDQRGRFVDAASHLRHDAGGDAHDVGVVAEREVGELELAAALDEDLLRPVDHDVGDGLVGEQRLERPQPEHVVEQHRDEMALLGLIELDFLLDQDLADDGAELARKFVAAELRRDLAVDPLHDRRVDARDRRFDGGAARRD